MSQLSLCTHNPTNSMYNYFSVSEQLDGPSIFLVNDSPSNLAESRHPLRGAGTRVPGLTIRDCTRCCNNGVPTCSQMSAISVTKKIFLSVCIWFRNEHIWALSQLSLCTLCNFLPRMAPHFLVIMIHQVIWPSPGTLAGTA